MPMTDNERRQAINDYDPDWNRTTEELEQEAALRESEDRPIKRGNDGE